MQSSSSTHRELRKDIQALRGFAVLVVLFFHAKIGASFGYLGVDVFFVISGYLITSMLQRSIQLGTFSFSDFYYRRAKRLLPAAYVTFVVTAALAPVFLASQELRDFRAQLVGAITFVSNVVLWRQAGYFEGAADLKPLLHVWSLAIEEQFYFILPAALCFLPERLRKKVVLAAVVASLSLCLLLVQRKPIAAFYLLPTRGWELGIGSLGALLPASNVLARVVRLSFWPSLTILLASPFFNIGYFHPGPDAILVCAATLAFILRHHPAMNSGRLVESLAWVGDLSYSLYLVHWPIFAFFNNIWLGGPHEQPPLFLRLGLSVASLLMAILLNRFVEVPFRKATSTKKPLLLAAAGIASVFIVLLGLWSTRTVVAKDYVHMRRANQGLHERCEFVSDFEPIPECKTSDHPEILVWGDSLAMHLVSGMAEAADPPPKLIQATRSMCGPILDFAKIKLEAPDYNWAWAERCIQFNDSVLDYIAKTRSLKFVVLSSLFVQFLDAPSGPLVFRAASGNYESATPGMALALEGARRTVRRLRELGKGVVVVAPPPSGGADMARCGERLEQGLLMAGVDPRCRIRESTYRDRQANVTDFLKQLSGIADVEVINFEADLCSSGFCSSYEAGVFIYRDAVHLSHEGSRFLAVKSGLLEKIKKVAR